MSEQSPYRHAFTWAVTMQSGTRLRVDADRCAVADGVLMFFCGTRAELLSACFDRGQWRHVTLIDRDTGKSNGWHVLKDVLKAEGGRKGA